MSKIQSIHDLRIHALETLEKLRDGEIEMNEAIATGKLCDNVINTVKIQVDYFRMTGEKPEIPFMQHENIKLIESEKPRLLEQTSTKKKASR